MFDFLITLTLFNSVLCIFPFLFISFFVLKICRSIWFTTLSQIHPDFEFVRPSSIRSLLDTHRNQAIVTVLLSVKGPAQPEYVRRHLQEVVNRRIKNGGLAFPRLRQCLTIKCGTYAWSKIKFDLDQNLTQASVNFKGRPVCESNIQDYVSGLVSKYLLANAPPWQVVIIPTSEDRHYLLFKMHHLLLSEGLNIADLLPVLPPTRQNPAGYFAAKSPLVDVFKKPTAIPHLRDRIGEAFSNNWNEFVANFDPLERLELLKNTPSFLQFVAICLITFVSILRECRRGYRVIKTDLYSKIWYTTHTIRRECKKRQVSVGMLLKSVLVSLNPANILSLFLNNTWYLVKFFTFLLPLMFIREVFALYNCLTVEYCSYPNTLIGLTYNYIPLIFNSLREIVYFLNILFHAPRNIVRDILSQKETLQTVTLCGRKSVSWSDPVKMEQLQKISKLSGVHETEILLSSVSACLSKYLTYTHQELPLNLPISMRNINSNYFFATGTKIRPEDSVSGILCMSLPILDPKSNDLPLNLSKVKANFRSALKKQSFSHLLTYLQTRFAILVKFVPNTVLSVYLKYLSRKFAVSVTEVSSRYPNVMQRTMWGQEVDGVIYWRPPQANTCISLCLNEYGDHIKLGVMVDSQLVPHHCHLSREFNEHLTNLEKSFSLKK